MWKMLLNAGKQITTRQLNLKNTLMNGQCFNWKEAENNSYIGVVSNNIIQMKEEEERVFYNFIYKHKDDLDEELFFRQYFQLEVDIEAVLNDLKLPTALNEVATRITGVRIIKQDVFECIISFICSSNNNIDRIRKMLESFRQLYGKLLLTHETFGEFYSFPTLDQLKKLKEQDLKDKGFGYRAKYIVKSLDFIRENNGEEWVNALESKDDPTDELIKLQGVGQKVADCIALFSLKKHSIVPLDIHMINFYNESIVGLDKSFKEITKTNKSSFKKVANNFIKIFGNYAGWLHSIYYMNRIDKSNKKSKSKKKESKSKMKTQEKSTKKGKRKVND
jgi:N-glycosylase/DNA lyase